MKYHTPVLLNESLEGLNINPAGIYVDLTFGGGGHSREILKRLTTGKLFAFDQDEDAQANILPDERFTFIGQNFRYMKNFLKYYHVDHVDGILADLGLSSHHLDVAERGFSFQHEGPLDMRMNQNAELTAAVVVNTYPKEELKNIFYSYGELSNSAKLCELIVKARNEKEIKTVNDFKTAIAACTPRDFEFKFLAKVFQALRIEVNGELDSLKEMLMQTIDVMKKDGRLVVITYHSLEDRIVKNFIKKGIFEGEVEKDIYGNYVVPFAPVNKKVILPELSEIQTNSKARSAKLRIGRRL